jgi:hypothetical protein
MVVWEGGGLQRERTLDEEGMDWAAVTRRG